MHTIFSFSFSLSLFQAAIADFAVLISEWQIIVPLYSGVESCEISNDVFTIKLQHSSQVFSSKGNSVHKMKLVDPSYSTQF